MIIASFKEKHLVEEYSLLENDQFINLYHLILPSPGQLIQKSVFLYDENGIDNIDEPSRQVFHSHFLDNDNNLSNVRRFSDSNINYNKPSFNFEEQQSDIIDLEIERMKLNSNRL